MATLQKPPMTADALAALLGGNQFQSPVLQRGTAINAAGEAAPDFTHSAYNAELDAQNAQTEAETTNRIQKADALHALLSPEAEQVQQEASDRALAPEKLKAQSALDVEKERTRGAQAVEQTKADIQGKAEAAKESAAEAKANAPTNQVKTQATYAKNAMGLIGETDSQVSDPQLTPYIGNIVGRMTGLGTENVSLPGDFAKSLTADPALQQKLGDFGFNLVATVSAIARAHNQRGATKELTQQFGSQVRASTSPAALHGALAAASRLMQGYAANDQQTGVSSPYPSDPLMGALHGPADPLGIR